MTDTLHGEVIGFRQWAVGDDLDLRSAVARHAWVPGDNTAQCMRGDGHRRCKHAPGEGCDCGLYALHTPNFWYSQGRRDPFSFYYGDPVGLPMVAGLVAAWGKLEVHHAGFRAERARIVAIALPEIRRDAVVALAVAKEYGAAAVPQDELERVASEFGTLVPEGMRPEKPEPQPGGLLANIVYGNLGNSANVVTFGTSNIWTTSWTEPHRGPNRAKRRKSKRQPQHKVAKAARDLIREMKEPKYDPRSFQPKHKGGNA